MEEIRCNLCGKNKFSTEKHLKRHIKQEHLQTIEYKCVHCEFNSMYLDNTKRHIRQKHNIEKKQEELHYVVQPRTMQKETTITINLTNPQELVTTFSAARDEKAKHEGMKLANGSSPNVVSLPINFDDYQIEQTELKQQIDLPESKLERNESLTCSCTTVIFHHLQLFYHFYKYFCPFSETSS